MRSVESGFQRLVDGRACFCASRAMMCPLEHLLDLSDLLEQVLGYTCSRQTSASSVLAERGLRPLGKARPVGDADHRQVEQGPEVKSEPDP
jgi:hypothetical protein